MRSKRLAILSLCLILAIVLLSGCWNYREIEKLFTISGFAIDKNDGKYDVSYELIEIKSGKEVKTSTRLLSVEGNSLFDTFRNSIKMVGKKLYASHAEIVVISREIAEEGITPVIDWLSRDTQPRDTLRLLISREKSAKTILEQQPVSMDVLSFELSDIFTWENKLSNTVDIELWQFRNDLAEASISPTLAAVGLVNDNGKTVSEVNGTAVFKKDRLVGFLNSDETKALLFIKNKLKGGLLTNKEYEDNSSANVSLEILKNKSKQKTKYENGKIIMDIITDTDVTIGEVGGSPDVIDEPGRTKLKKDFEIMLEKNIKELVEKVQEQYDSDIFGFGQTVKLNIPGLWKQIEPQWDQLFKDVKVEVHSTINIKNSALESKPIKVGD